MNDIVMARTSLFRPPASQPARQPARIRQSNNQFFPSENLVNKQKSAPSQKKQKSAPSASMNIQPMDDAPRTVNSVQNVRPTITLHPSARQDNLDKKQRNLQERNAQCIK